MKKLGKFFIGVRKEMAKVRWPNKKELIKYSIATIFIIIVMALFFVISDFILAWIKTLVNS